MMIVVIRPQVIADDGLDGQHQSEQHIDHLDKHMLPTLVLVNEDYEHADEPG